MTMPKMAQAGLQAGSIIGVADVLAQVCVEGKTMSLSHIQHLYQYYHGMGENAVKGTQNSARGNNDVASSFWDPRRTARWFGAGLVLQGPYFYVAFRRIDTYFGSSSQSFKILVSKLAVFQLILYPPYLATLFAYMGWMEGLPNHEIGWKVQRQFPEAFAVGCIYGPLANTINFTLVPPAFRIPYLATSAGVWNCYLSWMNHARQPTVPPPLTTTNSEQKGNPV